MWWQITTLMRKMANFWSWLCREQMSRSSFGKVLLHNNKLVSAWFWQILSQMLREQNAARLASAAASRSLEERKKDESELTRLREAEIEARQAKMKQLRGSRYIIYFRTRGVCFSTALSALCSQGDYTLSICLFSAGTPSLAAPTACTTSSPSATRTWFITNRSTRSPP